MFLLDALIRGQTLFIRFWPEKWCLELRHLFCFFSPTVAYRTPNTFFFPFPRQLSSHPLSVFADKVLALLKRFAFIWFYTFFFILFALPLRRFAICVWPRNVPQRLDNSLVGCHWIFHRAINCFEPVSKRESWMLKWERLSRPCSLIRLCKGSVFYQR